MDSNGTYYLGPENLSLRVVKNQVVRIPVRIWFGSGARAGTYYIAPGIDSYAVFNAAGQSFAAFLGGPGHTYTVHVNR